MSIPEETRCPECGETPTEESIIKDQLSDLGYEHRDTRLECSEGHTWQVGVPIGECEDETWVCDSCGGDFMPHFVTAMMEAGEMCIRPKCQTCYYVPDEPIVVDMAVTANAHGRALLGHHSVTGSREGARTDEF